MKPGPVLSDTTHAGQARVCRERESWPQKTGQPARGTMHVPPRFSLGCFGFRNVQGSVFPHSHSQ